MTEPTPDEATAELQAVLDTLDHGGRHCGCDPDLYGDTDFIGIVSDAQGRNHREVRGAAIRAVLADRKRLAAENRLLIALRDRPPGQCTRARPHAPHRWLPSRSALDCPGIPKPGAA